MFHFMTAITRAAMQGKTAERDMTDKRQLRPRKADRAKTSAPPRTRTGAAFPGGKHLRRVSENLAARRKAALKAPNKAPGSMR